MAAVKPRGILIAGNWKMQMGPTETSRFFSELAALNPAPTRGNIRASLFPPTISLSTAVMEARKLAQARGLKIAIGAQNAHWEKKGAFTGEVSGPMLQEVGATTVLVAHSERRQFFGETDETARKRAESLFQQGFEVVLCIGETRSEREAGKTEAVLEQQLTGGVPNACMTGPRRLVLAYEPVWAIGTGLTATPAEAETAHQFIRKWLWDRFGMESAAQTPVLYGGSVKPDNLESLLLCPNIDGALVGGASLDPADYAQMLKIAAQFL